MKHLLPILCLALSLAACSPEQDREFAGLVDRDGDGLGQLEDCDDNDPTITTTAQANGCQVGQYCTEDTHCPTGECDLTAKKIVWHRFRSGCARKSCGTVSGVAPFQGRH